MQLKKYITSKNEVLLYCGEPNLSMLDELANRAGDVWHSSLDQGYNNCFQDLMYQTAVYWWFLNDIKNQDNCVCWRINVNAFVVRETVWNQINGLDLQYESNIMSGLDFGYNLLRNQAGIPLNIKGLFPSEENNIQISTQDRYTFFFKNFKRQHPFYMMLRKGIFKFPSEFKAYIQAKKKAVKYVDKTIKPKALNPIEGKPTVSLVIPTMRRQAYTQLLLEDHKNQSYLIKEAVIVDATPEEERDDKFYRNEDFPFDVIVKWQTSKGSCRARNEAIDLCTGEYIIFADDDVRVLPDFVENHIRLLQTYNTAACNGLDIMAENIHQDLSDLKNRLAKIEDKIWKVGVSSIFSNANSCVRRDVVQKLIGNDVNFDGGYGEDADFGLSILKEGEVLLHNPYSPNLHLKPPQGGYRWWGSEAKKKGKNRKIQPWELNKPVKNIVPKPSPTITYGVLKHFTPQQVREWRTKHFFLFLFKNDPKKLPIRILQLPYKQLQFSKSLQYAKALINLGVRYK
ncbi:family 2 glycosyl transferase [Wenyingzhuangia fucanilytica]|uniref:Family 2 glycosyl transferase n=1 Tax=Wenyingzhuangia fucanilytica TaxID=1790137 RepID=A0A1B1Y6C4_9FLAO|nr:glycosyltransferase family A protein [Wenyingzhuangia fucanilytica]ANW96297.1 family 2 glycosyl transferase [Wenyingzhuangia fucanilytica]